MTLIGFLVAAQGFMLYWINSYCTALDCILESNMVISMKGQIVFWDKTSFHITSWVNMHKKKPFSFHQKTRLGECLPKIMSSFSQPFPYVPTPTRLGECLPKIIFYNLSLTYAPTPPVGATVSMWSLPEVELSFCSSDTTQ